MSRTTTKLTGFDELERALKDELPRATAKNVLRRSAISAMGRIEERAKQLVPIDDGQLRDSIKTKTAKAKRQKGSVKYAASSGVEVWTGPTGRPEGGNAAWQEYGTVKMTAQPFMRPAADEELPNVLDDVKAALTTQVDKARKRIARKLAKLGG